MPPRIVSSVTEAYDPRPMKEPYKPVESSEKNFDLNKTDWMEEMSELNGKDCNVQITAIESECPHCGHINRTDAEIMYAGWINSMPVIHSVCHHCSKGYVFKVDGIRLELQYFTESFHKLDPDHRDADYEQKIPQAETPPTRGKKRKT